MLVELVTKFLRSSLSGRRDQRDGLYLSLHPDSGDSVLAGLGTITIASQVPDPTALAVGAAFLVPYQHAGTKPCAYILEPRLTCLGTAAELSALTSIPRCAEVSKKFAAAQRTWAESDDTFAQRVERVQRDFIAVGDGSNVVMSNFVTLDGIGFSVPDAIRMFVTLCRDRMSGEWPFLFATEGVVVIGNSPERQIDLSSDGRVRMNPISGTIKVGPDTSQNDIAQFCADPKERRELALVLDEELKMLAAVSEVGTVTVTGPMFRDLGALIHSEYVIEGIVRPAAIPDLFTTVRYAPTVVGAPIASAQQAVDKYDGPNRSFFSGVFGVVGDPQPGPTQGTSPGPSVSSTIVIRSAIIDRDAGTLSVRAGSTIVQDSNPAHEAQEVAAKIDSTLRRLHGGGAKYGLLDSQPDILSSLRQTAMAGQSDWTRRRQNKVAGRSTGPSAFTSATVVDFGDQFTWMLASLLTDIGITAEVVLWSNTAAITKALSDGRSDHMIVLGPGPGDPTDAVDLRILAAQRIAGQVLESGKRFLAICLSHQIVAHILGYTVARLPAPNQGVQHQILLAGKPCVVGYYNSFAVEFDSTHTEFTPHSSNDDSVGERWADVIIGEHYVSTQFHPESILTERNLEVIDLLTDLVAGDIDRVEGVG